MSDGAPTIETTRTAPDARSCRHRAAAFARLTPLLPLVLVGIRTAGVPLPAWVLVAAILWWSCLIPARRILALAPGAAESLVGLLIGWSMLAVGFLLCRRLGAPPWVALAAMASLMLVPAHDAPSRSAWPSFKWWQIAVLLVVLLLQASPTLIASALMGGGAYPAVFFNVDSPALLTHVHALAEHAAYPPPDLTYAGRSAGYHYGVQAMAASLTALTGLPAHKALFWLVAPLLRVGTLAAGVLWLRALGMPAGAFVLGAALLWFTDLLPAARMFQGGALAYTPPWQVFVDDPQTFGQNYPLLTWQYGMFAGLAALWALFDAKSAGRRAVLLLLVLTMTAKFKIADWLALMTGIGCVALFLRARDGQRELLKTVLLAAVASILLMRVLPGSASDIRFEPLFHLSRKVASWHRAFAGPSALGPIVKGAAIDWALPLVMALLPGLVVVAVGPRRLPRRAWWPLALAAPMLVLVNLLAIQRLAWPGEPPVLYEGLLEALDYGPLALGAVLAMFLGGAWAFLGARGRIAATLAVGLALAPQLVHATIGLDDVVYHPQRWHEWTDNRLLGDVLAHAPAGQTVIVTNDLVYPADRYSRGLTQHQVAALFGHQAWASVFTYGQSREPDAVFRAAAQGRLMEARWSDDLTVIARRESWTHFLMSLRVSHPDPRSIPGRRIARNAAFELYELDLR